MSKPYIFAHRGGMGNCIENTLPCFEKAVRLGVGIETDFQLTKDKVLVCFHDHFIKQEPDWINLKLMTFQELKSFPFPDGREIVTAEELFSFYKDQNKILRFSCDIRGKHSGYELIGLAKRYSILENIEITERSMNILKRLRNYEPHIKLVHTLPEQIKTIQKTNVDFNLLEELGVRAINLHYWKGKEENFKSILDYGLDCYIWGVDRKNQMKKILRFAYRDGIVKAIYTDYPDVLIELRDQIFC